MTYDELAERSARLAAVFRSHRLGHHAPRSQLADWEIGQDTVGLYLLNGPEYLEASLAGHAARAAPFNVNYRYVAAELAYLLDDAGAAGLVFHARYAPTVAEVLPRLARSPRLLLQVADGSGHPLLPGALDYEEALATASPTPPEPDQHPDDVYLLYTGGTTGMPKGVIWRQADFWRAAVAPPRVGSGDNLDAIVRAAEARRPLRVQACAPLMHGAAHVVCLGALMSGDTVVINRVVDRLDPEDVWSTVERERVDVTLIVGEAYARPLLDTLEARPYDTSSLRTIVTGGAPTTPETKERILAALPHVRITDLAGSSEIGGGLRNDSAAGQATPAAGVFAAGPDVTVLDASRRHRLEPGHHDIGWFAKGGPIMLGYLGDPAKTRATLPVVDGQRWAVPGDRARLRADGLVELLGRDSVTINSGGEKIFAEEVERAMLSHPAIADTVVVGRPSARWGQEVVAIVQTAPGSSPSDDDLKERAGRVIARYKLPKAILRVPEIVRSPAGKADYGWARDMAAKHAHQLQG